MSPGIVIDNRAEFLYGSETLAVIFALVVVAQSAVILHNLMKSRKR